MILRSPTTLRIRPINYQWSVSLWRYYGLLLVTLQLSNHERNKCLTTKTIVLLRRICTRRHRCRTHHWKRITKWCNKWYPTNKRTRRLSWHDTSEAPLGELVTRCHPIFAITETHQRMHFPPFVLAIPILLKIFKNTFNINFKMRASPHH